MWKSFHDLFKHNDSKEQKKIKPLTWQSVVLNNKSVLLDISIKNDIKLWTHQKAMLARCKYIEEHSYYCEAETLHNERYLNKSTIKDKALVAIGILNDPPGSGKTNVVLSLISLDTQYTFNIIIVPKNLIGQWKNALDTFYPSNTNTLWTICDYAKITELYIKPDALSKYKIVLIDETLVDTFALANTLKANRVIIDEVDNIKGSMTQTIKTSKLWFMSASYSVYDNNKYDLPYKINQDYIGNICVDVNQNLFKNQLN